MFPLVLRSGRQGGETQRCGSVVQLCSRLQVIKNKKGVWQIQIVNKAEKTMDGKNQLSFKIKQHIW